MAGSKELINRYLIIRSCDDFCIWVGMDYSILKGFFQIGLGAVENGKLADLIF
jgi:hypothetical protein